MATRKLLSASIYTNEGSNKEPFVKYVLYIADCFGTLPIPGSEKTLFFSQWGEYSKFMYEALKTAKFRRIESAQKKSVQYVVDLEGNDDDPETAKDIRSMLLETAALSWQKAYCAAEEGTFFKRRVKEGATSKLIKEIGFWYVPDSPYYGLKAMETNAKKEYDIIRPTLRANEPDKEIEEEF